VNPDECRELTAVRAGRATGYRYDAVARWLRRARFEPPRNPTGSHRVWRHPSGRRAQLVDRGKGELLPVYVKRAIDAIFDAREC